MSQASNASIEQARFQQGAEEKDGVLVRHVGHIVFTLAGFLLAVAANVLVPQVSSVPLDTYRAGILLLNRNGLYRIVLFAIAFIYLVSGIVSTRNETRRLHFDNRSAFRFAMGIALLLWDVFGTKYQLLQQPFFPGPSQVLESFLIEGAYIFSNLLYSLRLFSVGFLAGVVFGVGTGILIGVFPRVYYWVHPVLKMTGIIPAVAWMPFALTLFPTPFSAAVFLISISAWFPIAFGTASGVMSTPTTYFEAARTLGASKAYRIWHVSVPHALPQIFTGITTACANAFVMLVISEMMGQPGGLGYYINAAKMWSTYYKVFAAIVIMAILFSLITKLLGLIQARALRWQKGVIGS